MTEEARSCANCAVSHVIEPPKVETPQRDQHGRVRLEPHPPLKPQRVCRLNPPSLVMLPNNRGTGLMQSPTEDNFVCWHWKKPGTLPGD